MENFKRQKISKKRIAKEIDSSTGLSYNGTTHVNVEPKPINNEYNIRMERYFIDEGEGLSDARKLSMINNEELILKMTPIQDHEKAKEQISKWRKELNNK